MNKSDLTDTLVIKEMKKIPGIERWFADAATRPDLIIDDMVSTPNPESFQNGARQAMLSLRRIVIESN